MKQHICIILLVFGLLFSCNSSTKFAAINNKPKLETDTVRIANDEIEYEVVIIDIGFSSWFNSYAKPRGYYTENYLRDRNIVWTREWNRRVLLPLQYNPNLYEMRIDYDANTNYGYEVNYMIYNYLVYFQLTYKQPLGVFNPQL